MALILVTGASGRLGTALCRELRRRGHQVRALMRPYSTASLPADTERFDFDLSGGSLSAAAFEGAQYVVHLAARLGELPYSELYLHNANGTKNLLLACPPAVQKIIIASSISVYGEYKGKVVDESFPPKGESAYGKSKLAAEDFARQHSAKLPIILLRFGMIYGPGFEDGYYPVLDMLSEGKMRLLGNGSNRIPLLHVDDAIQAILLSLEAKTPSCREYNIVGQEQPTQKELLLLAAQELGVAAPTKQASPELAKASLKARTLISSVGLAKPPSFTADNIRQLTLDRAYSGQRAKEELGFEAKVKLREGLKEVVKSYLAKRREKA